MFPQKILSLVIPVLGRRGRGRGGQSDGGAGGARGGAAALAAHCLALGAGLRGARGLGDLEVTNIFVDCKNIFVKDNGRHFTVLLDLLTVMQCSFWTGLQTCLLISLVACSQVVSGTVRHTAASSVAQLVLYTVRHCSQSQVSIRVSVDQSQASIHLLLLHGRALLPQRGDAAPGGGDHRHTHTLGHWHPVAHLLMLNTNYL